MDKMKILVVEEERIVADDIKKTAQSIGYDVSRIPYTMERKPLSQAPKVESLR